MTGDVAIWDARGHRLRVLSAVIGAHLLAAWALSLSVYSRQAEPALMSLTTVYIQTNNPARRSVDSAPLVSRAMVLQDLSDPVMGLPTPPLIQVSEPNGAAVSVAPQLLDTTPADIAPFARQGGLLPGESAVVVLRIEVLPDGSTGQIQVDISSGSDQVDLAAIEYARLLAWVPGRVHGIEESTWVRQAVRLVA